MNKFIAACLTALLLAGCGPDSHERPPMVMSYADTPSHLKDCTFTKIWDKRLGYMMIVRCPNSSTTCSTETRGGKTSSVMSVSTIDNSPPKRTE